MQSIIHKIIHCTHTDLQNTRKQLQLDNVLECLLTRRIYVLRRRRYGNGPAGISSRFQTTRYHRYRGYKNKVCT